MSKKAGLIIHRQKGSNKPSNSNNAAGVKPQRGSIDIAPEDWPTMEHIASPLPAPSAGAATYELMSELRDMQLVVPPSPFAEESQGSNGQPPVDQPRATDNATRSNTSEPAPSTKVNKHAPREEEFKTVYAAGSPYRLLRVRLPTAGELPTFTAEFSAHLQELAMSTLRVMLYPRVLLRLRQRQRARMLEGVDGAPNGPKLTTTMLGSSPIFKNWPPEAVQAAIGDAQYNCFDAREYIAFEGEVPAAAYFVVSGTCKLLTRLPPPAVAPSSSSGSTLPSTHIHHRNKRITSSNCHPASLAISPATFGLINLLTNEPYQQTLRSVGKVEVYALSRTAFQRALALVPPHVSTHTIATAFERRNERMRSVFPISVEQLRSYKLFSRVSLDFAGLILDKLEPHAIPAQFTMLHGGKPCEAMYFVASGRLEVVKAQDEATHHHHHHGNPAAPPSVVWQAPTLVGDSALMYNSANEHTITTVTDCDAYVLSKAAFVGLCRQHPTEVDTMLDAARDQRKAELRENHTRFRAVIAKMPLVRDVLPTVFERDFLNLFTPKSYRPMSCVCSTSNFCDKILVLTKGKLRLGGSCETHATSGSGDATANDALTLPYQVRRWESIGWTCCVPHRWGHTAMSMETTVETLELSYLDYMLFLHERGLLDRVTQWVKMLLFPRAFPSDTVQALRDRTGAHVPMYPISTSLAVNLYEIGFCTVHMSAVMRMAEKANKRPHGEPGDAKQVQMVPPQYRRLSKGVWVPQLMELKRRH